MLAETADVNSLAGNDTVTDPLPLPEAGLTENWELSLETFQGQLAVTLKLAEVSVARTELAEVLSSSLASSSFLGPLSSGLLLSPQETANIAAAAIRNNTFFIIQKY
jgi:hypothetical protein